MDCCDYVRKDETEEIVKNAEQHAAPELQHK
jgi:hypothetical protein